MEGGGGYSTPTDRLPFLAFSDIYNDPARVARTCSTLAAGTRISHLPATAPNFVWFAADDETNMEGPTDIPVSASVQWALS